MSETVVSAIDTAVQPQLKEVINRLSSEIPQDFRERALVAARYITQLDSGITGGDGERRFRDQLLGTGFIGAVNMRYQYRMMFSGAPDPQVALPRWLQKGVEPDLEDTKPESVVPKYQEWVQTEGFKVSESPNGRYYEVGSEEDPSVPITRTFKCYVEGKSLTEGLGGEIQKVIGELEEQGLGPNSMKLFEGDRLVLYYHWDVGLSDRIRKTFEADGLDFRGPAQDVWEVKITEDGALKLGEPVSSSDGLLGDGGHSPIGYKLKEYRAADFLENYLQLCLWAGKAPDEPYKTSFVWFVDPEKRAQGRKELLAEAEEMTGYPVLYAEQKSDFF